MGRDPRQRTSGVQGAAGRAGIAYVSPSNALTERNCQTMGSDQRLTNADGLRGLACMIVVSVHASSLVLPETFPYLVGTGKIGGWLFFVLNVTPDRRAAER
jgi:hypothetical protein